MIKFKIMRMILRELARLSSQHQTFYCYLILSLWIFLLIAGMYKYIAINGNGDPQTFFNVRQYNAFIAHDEAMKLEKYQTDCNLPHTIVRQDDGGVLNGWQLQGVLSIIRHGDRGPMTHVRGINSIDCSKERDRNTMMNKYRSFLLNTTTNAPAGHYIWNKSGSFHNFPLLPAFPKSCLLGQLTYNGIAQLLQVGDIFKQVYGHQLGLLNKPAVVPKPSNGSSTQPLYPPDEIIIYSTRYRRTFQSAMALMYGFVTPDRWLSLNVRESHSLAFCFADCACPQAEQIKDMLNKESAKQLIQHPTIAAVVQWIGTNLLQNPTPKMKPLEVRDAILSLICHNAPLPCRKNNYNDFRQNGNDDHSGPASTTEESNDLINIDQDENNNINNGNTVPGLSNNRIIDPEAENNGVDPELDGCVEASHVSALMSYTDWESIQEASNKLTRRQGLLRAYGLIHSIVDFMLKIISGDKTRFVLYSGHDRTLQYLVAALGLKAEKSFFIPYASRMAFEIYKSDAGTGDVSEYYFRLINNGQDVTRQINFCEGGRSLRISKDSRQNKADLCPIENIIRFIHDDYFNCFNATNFKDACIVTKRSEF